DQFAQGVDGPHGASLGRYVLDAHRSAGGSSAGALAAPPRGPIMTRPMTKGKATNIVWHPGAVTRADREQLNGHRGCTVWLTGLSGSGKSTIAVALGEGLCGRGVRFFLLDGDHIRRGLHHS